MDRNHTRDSTSDPEERRRQTVMEREISPLDRRIARLRDEIRDRIDHLRKLRAFGFPSDQSVRLLDLLCRTLEADRAYRRAMIRLVTDRRR